VNLLAIRWLAGAAGLLALLGLIAWTIHDLEAKGAAKERAATQEATIEQQRMDAAVTARRVSEQARIAHDATVQADAARAAAAAAARSRDSLRVRLDAYVAANSRPADPAASAGGETAPLAVLAKLLRETQDFAGEAASDADAARIAGDACQAAYGQLMP
jgi:hypothetical protein